MSKFLGPVHHWLFNKIKLHESLEKQLIETYKQKYGEAIHQIVQNVANHYGAPIEDQPLDQLIDTGNIHGWLQQKISIAETRQAAFLTEIFNKYGESSVEIALSIYGQQGAQSGAGAKLNDQTDSGPSIYKSLNNYILDGMPCDNVNNVSIAEPDKLQWKSVRCLHKGYWESVKADIDIFYQLRTAWIRSFVENANPDFIYQVTKTNNNGFIHEIIKKQTIF